MIKELLITLVIAISPSDDIGDYNAYTRAQCDKIVRQLEQHKTMPISCTVELYYENETPGNDPVANLSL